MNSNCKTKFIVKLAITTESKLTKEMYANTKEEAENAVVEGFYKGFYDDDIKLVTENVTEIITKKEK